MKKRNLPRRLAPPLAALPALLALACCLAGCLGGLPEGVDAAVIETNAKEATDLALAGDYQGLIESFRPDLAGTLDAAEWEDALAPYLNKAGAFVDYSGYTAGSQKVEGTEYVVALVTAECENQNLIFTLYFDTDSNLTGFYVKDG